VETANRFARDLMVQEVGFAMLRDLGVTLIAADRGGKRRSGIVCQAAIRRTTC
jgi:hypothetical protein